MDGTLKQKRKHQNSHNACDCNIGLAKKFVRIFCRLLWENPNELFGQPNMWQRWDFISVASEYFFFFFFRKLFIYIIIFLWLHWFFVAASGFSSWLQPAGAILCCGVWISHCGDFSFCRAQVLGTWASVVVTQAPEHRLSSCSAWA